MILELKVDWYEMLIPFSPLAAVLGHPDIPGDFSDDPGFPFDLLAGPTLSIYVIVTRVTTSRRKREGHDLRRTLAAGLGTRPLQINYRGTDHVTRKITFNLSTADYASSGTSVPLKISRPVKDVLGILLGFQEEKPEWVFIMKRKQV